MEKETCPYTYLVFLPVDKELAKLVLKRVNYWSAEQIQDDERFWNVKMSNSSRSLLGLLGYSSQPIYVNQSCSRQRHEFLVQLGDTQSLILDKFIEFD
jgi:hypothetical protein